MAVTQNVLGTKLNLKFKDGDKSISKTYSNVKEAATDQELFDSAGIIASLSDRTVEKVKKVVESELVNL